MWPWIVGALGLGFFFIRGRKRAPVDVPPATDDPGARPMVTGHTYFVVARTSIDGRRASNDTAPLVNALWSSQGFPRTAVRPSDVDPFVWSGTAPWAGGARLRDTPEFRVISVKDLG